MLSVLQLGTISFLLKGWNVNKYQLKYFLFRQSLVSLLHLIFNRQRKAACFTQEVSRVLFRRDPLSKDKLLVSKWLTSNYFTPGSIVFGK